MRLPLLAASDYGIAVAIVVLFAMFLVVGWVIVQGTRAQLEWRKLVDRGDVDAIKTLVGDEIDHWKTKRMPKGTDPTVWHGVQGAELLAADPEGVRLSVTADARFAMVEGVRREVSSALHEGMRVTAKLADMVMYDVPNAKLGHVQIDVYTAYRDDNGSGQRCILSTICRREVADVLAWDEIDAEEAVRTFGGRFLLDDRGNPLAIDPDATTPSGVPAAFYKDD